MTLTRSIRDSRQRARRAVPAYGPVNASRQSRWAKCSHLTLPTEPTCRQPRRADAFQGTKSQLSNIYLRGLTRNDSDAIGETDRDGNNLCLMLK